VSCASWRSICCWLLAQRAILLRQLMQLRLHLRQLLTDIDEPRIVRLRQQHP